MAHGPCNPVHGRDSLGRILPLQRICSCGAVGAACGRRTESVCACCGHTILTYAQFKEAAQRSSGCGEASSHLLPAERLPSKCEGCGIKAPSFGLPGEGKKYRWCGGCAKGQAGAVNMHDAARPAIVKMRKAKNTAAALKKRKTKQSELRAEARRMRVIALSAHLATVCIEQYYSSTWQ